MRVAVVGATGLVGTEMLKVLDETQFPVAELVPVASEASVGKAIRFRGNDWQTVSVAQGLALGPQLALFSAGGAVSLEWAPRYAASGAWVIDNSSAWRLRPDVPLVVSEVNFTDVLSLAGGRLVANPNCTTMQLMVVLKPLLDAFGINRVVVSTYQSVTGTGKRAIDQLEAERLGGTDLGVYPCPIDKNVIPHCDAFLENGYTREEMKVVWESRKILHQPDLRITCTAVRVPVVGGHSESVNVELGRDFQLDEVREVLATAPGLVVLDNPSDALYPTPRLAQGRNDVLVGRIRRDESNSNSLNLWVVADNLRKGAATNAVQIAHGLLQHGLLSNAKPAGVPLS